MDNHLWEHEDIAGAKLIVCVWSACQPGVCATGSGCPAVKPGYTYGSVFRRPVMDCSNRVFWSEKRIRVCIMYVQAFDHIIDLLRFDMLFVFSYSNLKSLLHKHTHTRANASRWVRMHSLAPPAPFKCSPSQTGPASAFPAHLISSSADCLDMGNVRLSLASAVWLIQTFVKC